MPRPYGSLFKEAITDQLDLETMKLYFFHTLQNCAVACISINRQIQYSQLVDCRLQERD